MQALLYANLSTETVSDTLRGSGYSFPPFFQGDQIRIQLRFVERLEGENVEVSREIRSLRSALGRVDSPPDEGEFKLSVNGTNLESVQYPVTAEDFQTALETAGLTEVTVTEKSGSLMIESQAELEFEIVENCLLPISFIRFFQRECAITGHYHYEIRFQQSAVAATDGWSRVVPKAPYVTRVQAGFSTDGTAVPEVQHLHVPPNFRGTYLIRRGVGNLSDHLARENDVDEIATAITDIADSGGVFTVTQAYDGVARIEFGGDMAGIPQDLLEIQVVDAPEGDATLTLDLNTAEVQALFRDTDEVKLPFEIEAELVDENDDEVTRIVTLCHAEVTVKEHLVKEADGTIQRVDYHRPPLPKDHIPFTLDQVITGSQHYPFELTTATSVIDHNLETNQLHVTLVDPDTRQRIPDNEYTLTITDDNSIEISDLQTLPADGVLTSAGPVDAFQAHTHTIEQIEGLLAILNDYGSRLNELERQQGTGKIATRDDISDLNLVWQFEDFFEIYPLRGRKARRVEIPDSKSLLDLKKDQFPRQSGLLAAVHDASVESLPTIGSGANTTTPQTNLDQYVGRVFENQTGGQVFIVGGGGRRGVYIGPGEFATCDGRYWYQVGKYGENADTETSYYPTDFERTLFELAVNDDQLRTGKTFETFFALGTRVIKSNVKYHWTLVVEYGDLPQDTDPAPTGVNLQNVVWNPAPMLERRIMVMPMVHEHVFGIRIARELRAGEDTITADQILYDGSRAANVAPSSANFALRARLTRGDTENNETEPKGFLALSGFKQFITTEGVSSDNSLALGVAVIK